MRTKNLSLKLLIEELSHEGRGIAHMPSVEGFESHAGKTLFIRGALPGEIATIDNITMHRRYGEATALAIDNPSAYRVAPTCQHVGSCGGCALQHLAQDKVLDYQTTWILEQLQHFGQVMPEHTAPPITGPQWGYRRRARLGVKWVEKKQKLLIGFREHNGRYLADLEACVVLIPEVGQQFAALRELILSLSCFKAIPQIEITEADEGVVLVIRHLEPFTESDLDKIRAFAAKHLFIIYLQPQGPNSVTALTPITTLTYTLPKFQLRFAFMPGDFVQINRHVNEAMIEQALAWLALTPDDAVLDLFCGLGNFSLPLATKAKYVTGVEGDERMVQQASFNANLNQLDNTQFVQANLFEPDKDAPWLQQRYDKILLDPPRAGAQALMPIISQLGAKLIVYVSCHSATLARDLGILKAEGYQLRQLGLIDMFTHTTHVEVMALLSKTTA